MNNIEKITEYLKNKGIKINISACGCCNSPWIALETEEGIVELDGYNVELIKIYQPIFTEEEWDKGTFASFQVYSSREKALEDWPNHTIGEYNYNEIEDYLIIK